MEAADSSFYLVLEGCDTICPAKPLLEHRFPELITKFAGPTLQIPLENFWLLVFS